MGQDPESELWFFQSLKYLLYSLIFRSKIRSKFQVSAHSSLFKIKCIIITEREMNELFLNRIL